MNNIESLPIYMVTAGKNHLQEPRNRPHGALAHHLLFIEQGKGMFETSTQKFFFSAGTVLFIRKGFPIAYRGVTPDFRTAWITFDGTCVPSLLSYFHADDLSECDGKALYPELLHCERLFNRMADEAERSAAVYHLVLSYFLTRKNTFRVPPVAKALAFLRENYGEGLSVASIASAAGISPSLLFRLFRESEQRTPIEMLCDIRMENARRLLCDRRKKIGEVAALCGFSDFAYFCKVFRQKNGMSPSAWRNSIFD